MSPALFAAYFTGAGGSNFALLYFGAGILSGIDGALSKYDGSYLTSIDGTHKCKVRYTVPSGTPLVTGRPLEKDLEVELAFDLPKNFWEGQIIEITTPTGPVNIKFEKLRDLQ